MAAAGHGEEGLVERRVRLGAERRVINRRARQLLQPIVGPRVELDNVEPLAQKREERQKERAIEPVLVEVVRRHVRRRDDDDAGLNRAVNNLPRIIASAMSRTANSSKQRREASRASSAATGADRVFADDFAPLARLTPSMQAGVHIGHEAMEMRAPL